MDELAVSARLPRCDRWKIGVAVDRPFAHMLAASEQEYDESDSDQRADDAPSFPVGALFSVIITTPR